MVGTFQRAVHVLDTNQLAESLDHAMGFNTVTCKINNELKLGFSQANTTRTIFLMSFIFDWRTNIVISSIVILFRVLGQSGIWSKT